ISGSQLRKILQGEDDPRYDSTYIIDCRSTYEYAGGHIQGAMNQCTREGITEMLFHNPSPSNKSLLVLYCEYSKLRAPHMASYIQGQDRVYNRYPNLAFPSICILKGGYRTFY
ncbi:Rhodanese-like protein, partial [Setomelanomma holmii]